MPGKLGGDHALHRGYVLKGEALNDWVSSDSDDLDAFVEAFDDDEQVDAPVLHRYARGWDRQDEATILDQRNWWLALFNDPDRFLFPRNPPTAANPSARSGSSAPIPAAGTSRWRVSAAPTACRSRGLPKGSVIAAPAPLPRCSGARWVSSHAGILSMTR